MNITTKDYDDIKEILLEKGQYAFVELSCEVKQNKDNTGNNLIVEAKFIGNPPLTTTAGGEVNYDGKTIRQYVSLVRKDNYDPDIQVKRIAQACNYSGHGRIQLSDIDGKFCKIKIGINPATDKYAESNSIAGYFPIKEEDNFVPPAF